MNANNHRFKSRTLLGFIGSDPDLPSHDIGRRSHCRRKVCTKSKPSPDVRNMAVVADQVHCATRVFKSLVGDAGFFRQSCGCQFVANE